MKRRWFALLALALASPQQAWCAQGAGQPATDTALRSLLQPRQGLAGPGFILAVTRRGERLYEIASGAADVEQQRPIDRNTVFHIASLSKQITAAALAHAVMDGRVSLDDPVSRWIPEAGRYGEGLTVAHLVYMTSGLTEYYDVPRREGVPWSTFHYFDIDDAISASLSVETLRFEPGTRWHYSNINYMLLTRIVAAAYGMPFREVVRTRIFAPLGMRASLVNDDVTTVIPRRANGYTERTQRRLSELREAANIAANEGPDLVMIRRNSPHYGGSGVMTSMADWSRWQAEMLSRARFGQRFWTLMLSTRRFRHDKVNDALGLVHGARAGRDMIWYSGGDVDASSFAATFPASGISVACFSNDPNGGCEEKALKVADLLMARGEL